MNYSDTPRTDEAWAQWQWAGPGVSVHFSRKLERELNEVRDQRDRAIKIAEELYKELAHSPFCEMRILCDDPLDCNCHMKLIMDRFEALKKTSP